MTRREVLWSVAVLAPAGGPFDTLPESVRRNAERNGLRMVRLPTMSSTSSRARIKEPGERLLVTGQVFHPDGRSPAASVMVYAYQTDRNGRYAEQQNAPPRLYAWMQADGEGRFELETIRPGSYPGSRIPQHIHFAAYGAGYPLQSFRELQFEDDPFLTAQMKSDDARLDEFRSIRAVRRGADGVWRCEVKIRMARETNYR